MRGYVPVGEVRAHISHMRGSGLTVEQVADRTGTPLTTILSIVYAPGRKWVQAGVADPILSTRVPGLDVPSVRARRQLQALACMGWSAGALAARCDMSRHALAKILTGTSGGSARSHAAIGALYRDLWDVPAVGHSAATVRGLAAAKGWAPPMAWDDELMGNPSVQPMGVLRSLRMPADAA